MRGNGSMLDHILCQTRYPDDCFAMPDLTTTIIAIDQAKKIYDFVIDKVSKL